MNPIQVAIVDDQRMFIQVIKDKLAFFPDISISFTASNGSEAIQKFENYKEQTNIILMDIEMPELNGIEATRQIKARANNVRILMLTVFDNEDSIFNAIQAGADGYLLKDVSGQELYKSIIQTIEGGAAMTPSVAAKTLQLLRASSIEDNTISINTSTLSDREMEILELIAKGHTNTQIAELIFISPSTVRKHLENIYSKLQVHSKVEAINEARKHKWIN
ncbi:MAG: response regulator transcription factor [Chitinophagales bacterium]|nr:response regulator transcription factor [Chitinophagales bacterium]